MITNSATLLTATTHQGDSSIETVTGTKSKGDGYYGRSDGLHTVQYTYTDFTGEIQIQATLEVNPLESDWFTVVTKTVEQQTSSDIANFVGNYVWIRARVIYTDGTINNINLNH